jgi:Ca2+-binding RTX toxin-like protein
MGMRRTVVLVAVMAAVLVMASGVALAVNKIGTNGPDTLRGTNGNDILIGKSGNDQLYALGGRDNLLGGPGKDIVLGGTFARVFGGDKNLVGGRGNDVVFGGLGSDKVVGEAGNDYMADGTFDDQSEDILSGGAGNDVILVVNRPAFKDIVTCGSGFDRVLADRKDVVAPDCERVVIGLASQEEFFNSIPQRFFEGLHPRVF